ncbi:glycosyltransferase [Paenibacillus sp. GCM10023252]|uniref:glycosyltransferase n=1 Tax=Paenibacillus sp. GCM10023252 TaxID=3252649 RepID=UPI003607C1A8
MEVVLRIVIVLLAAQLVFVLWNVRQLPPFRSLGVRSSYRAGEKGKAAERGDRQCKHQLSRGTLGSAALSNAPMSNAALCSTTPNHAASSTADEPPFLSVLIPARDEEANIGECLRSIMNSMPSSGGIEIIVLDDGSSDRTAAIVLQLAANDPRVRLNTGREKPEGWMGKAYACHQLAQAARGQWLLYMDADARMSSDAIIHLEAAAMEQRQGLITGFPYQVTGSWLERLVVPMMGFTIACHLPIHLVRHSDDARFVAAHGAWIAVARHTYEAAGGHQANRADLVDDMALARAVKKAGHPVILADVKDQVSMRMYRNAREVWNGYKKNMYAGVGRSLPLLAAVLILYSLLYLLPAIGLLLSLWMPDLLIPSIAGYGLGVFIKLVSDRSQGQPAWLALLIPLSIAAITAIGIASWLGAVNGKGYVWKGRVYG